MNNTSTTATLTTTTSRPRLVSTGGRSASEESSVPTVDKLLSMGYSLNDISTAKARRSIAAQAELPATTQFQRLDSRQPMQQQQQYHQPTLLGQQHSRTIIAPMLSTTKSSTLRTKRTHLHMLPSNPPPPSNTSSSDPFNSCNVCPVSPDWSDYSESPVKKQRDNSYTIANSSPSLSMSTTSSRAQLLAMMSRYAQAPPTTDQLDRLLLPPTHCMPLVDMKMFQW